MSSVRALRQVEVEPPQVFSDAVTPSLFERLRLTPVPVLFLRQQEDHNGKSWGGFCTRNEYTEAGEVVIDAIYVETSLHKPRARTIQHIYLHEVAHRLTPGHGHDAVFGAVNLLLYLRAGDTEDTPLWHTLHLYCFHDEQKDMPRAIAWAWNIAHTLASTDRTAEECAALILAEHTKWCTWLAGEAERQQARHEAARASTQAIEDRIRWLKGSRWLWALGGAILGAGGAIRLLL